MNFFSIIETTVYFLALINPPSKILLLATHQPSFSRKELFSISFRSTIAAFLILVILAGIGSFLLVQLFRVEIYSLNVAGGIVIFLVGLSAVQKGRFFYEDVSLSPQNSTDISIVPLAAPLIAGPGIITAAISTSSSSGMLLTMICLIIALLINLVLMLFSLHIGRAMERMHMMGPVIRITGLIVLAVAVQMIFTGCGNWLRQILFT
jgi:multiple antibiotic resistance protein